MSPAANQIRRDEKRSGGGSGPARYWRLIPVEGADGESWDSSWGVYGWAVYVISFSTLPIWTDLSAVSYGAPAVASREQSASFDAAKAFDNNDSTRWIASTSSPTPEWIYCDLLTPQEVHSMEYNLSEVKGPKNMYLQASSDAISWDTRATIATANTTGFQYFNNL